MVTGALTSLWVPGSTGRQLSLAVALTSIQGGPGSFCVPTQIEFPETHLASMPRGWETWTETVPRTY